MKTGIVFPGAEGRQRHMGQIRTTITLTNFDDMGRARHGDIAADAVRTTMRDRALVDTGANLLALPAEVVAQLGLDLLREVDIETAVGFGKARVFGYVMLTVEGRSAPFECLELPGGDAILLGVLPLETLGIELDLKRQRLVLLPDRGPDTYIMAL
jgi:predicted aspartyl protease